MNNTPNRNWFLPLLCQALLQDPSPNNRASAAQTLIAIEELPQEVIDILGHAIINDPSEFVRTAIIQAIKSHYTPQHQSTMSDSSKVQMNFYGTVHGAAGTVQGNQTIQPTE